MRIVVQDRAPLEKVRRLADGRIAATAKFARSGCQTYAGREVGRPDIPSITVYRPEGEVFAEDAMASFAHKAITLDHPAGNVTAANWQKTSVGFTEGRIARDGAYLEIPLMLADASAVQAYDQGKRELSAGYECELSFEDGTAPDGTAYQAVMHKIRGNHIAIVAQGKAGSHARIGDSAPNDRQAVDDARRAWIADKATSYRTSRTEPSAAPPARDTSPADVKAARAAWLADKQTAYRGSR